MTKKPPKSGFRALSLRIYTVRRDRRHKIHESIELMFPGYLLIQLPAA